MVSTTYDLPCRIRTFFADFVNHPFEDHAPSHLWIKEVLSRPWSYRTRTILKQGRADFTTGHDLLTPDDKVLLYCHHYMQMHTVSGFHVFQRAAKWHRLDFARDLVFLDFGCGPLTSGVALAWHHRTHHRDDTDGPLLHYLGIDRAPAMLALARKIAAASGLFHPDATFAFAMQPQSFQAALRLIADCRRAKQGQLVVVFNCSYFFASHSLDVDYMAEFVGKLLRQHLANDRVCLIFQNPDHAELNQKWERFKGKVKELRTLTGSVDSLRFRSTINDRRTQPCHIRLRYELLLNERWRSHRGGMS